MMQLFIKIKQKIRSFSGAPALIGTIITIIIFTIFSNKFLTVDSISGTLAIVAEMGIVTVGISFLMITGHFDLSVGSVFGIASMAFAMMAKAGWPHVIALVATLAVCALIGFIQGLIVIKTRVSSFIITLGGLMLWRGVLLAITGGFPIIVYEEKSWLLQILAGTFVAGFRTSIFWLIALVIIFNFILNQTPYGNSVFATGGDPKAARAQGINVNRTVVINFAVCSLLAGFAGVIQFSRFMSVDALRGKEYELQAIAAAVIGGVLLTGGQGTIIGAVLGVLIVAMVKNGLILVGADPYWYRAFLGVIIIIAAIINMRVGRRVSHE
jgi:simple sugar transport system permease protein